MTCLDVLLLPAGFSLLELPRRAISLLKAERLFFYLFKSSPGSGLGAAGVKCRPNVHFKSLCEKMRSAR